MDEPEKPTDEESRIARKLDAERQDLRMRRDRDLDREAEVDSKIVESIEDRE